MESPSLNERIRQAPKTPGVYFWRDARGRPLYIGKAANLRSRLLNYPKTADSRIRLMVDEAAKLDWVTVETDIEALILESQFIRRYRPKFNVEFRDDKAYLLVAVTDVPFPQFILTHQVRSDRIKKPVREYIGPFTDGLPLKTTMHLLRRLFPTCSCKVSHHVRCLNAHIGKCPGYCCLKSSATLAQRHEYARHVRAVRDILTGRRASLVGRLEKEMKAAGKRLDFEHALSLRYQAQQVRRVFENAQFNARRQRSAALHAGALEQLSDVFGLALTPRRMEGYDIANIQQQLPVGSMAVFSDGRADRAEYRLFNVRRSSGGDTAMLAEVLTRRLRHDEWPLPDLILVDGSKAQLNAVLRVLRETGRQDIPVLALTKDERHRGDYVVSSLDGRVRMLKDLPRQLRDLLVHLDSEAHRFAISHYRRRHRRDLVAR